MRIRRLRRSFAGGPVRDMGLLEHGGAPSLLALEGFAGRKSRLSRRRCWFIEPPGGSREAVTPGGSVDSASPRNWAAGSRRRSAPMWIDLQIAFNRCAVRFDVLNGAGLSHGVRRGERQ